MISDDSKPEDLGEAVTCRTQVDILYLHNAAEAQARILGEAGFRARLTDAFTWLEGARTSGRIQVRRACRARERRASIGRGLATQAPCCHGCCWHVQVLSFMTSADCHRPQ